MKARYALLLYIALHLFLFGFIIYYQHELLLMVSDFAILFYVVDMIFLMMIVYMLVYKFTKEKDGDCDG